MINWFNILLGVTIAFLCNRLYVFLFCEDVDKIIFAPNYRDRYSATSIVAGRAPTEKDDDYYPFTLWHKPDTNQFWVLFCKPDGQEWVEFRQKDNK